MTGADEVSREVYCLDAATGGLIWTTPVALGEDPDSALRIHAMTGYAASTATSDGIMVYAIFATGHLVALDFSGELVWQTRYDFSEDIYGNATSLILHGDLLMVQNDLSKPAAGNSHMLALDKRTGETVWDIPRPVQGSWTTPIIIDTGEREELITSAKPWVIAYDPLTGAEYWRVDAINGDSAPSPIFVGGQIMVANVYAELTAIRPGGAGDVTQTHVNWSVRGVLPDIASPLGTGELVFTLASNGTLSCFDAADGALQWSEQLGRRFRTSPSLVGDRVYLISDAGESIVVAAEREFREIATGHFREPVHSCPSFAGGRTFVRGEQHLFCIDAASAGE